MDKYVIMKEPGYEDFDLESGENMQYTMIVRYNTLKYAVADMINNPPVLMREVVHAHFREVKERVREMAQ